MAIGMRITVDDDKDGSQLRLLSRQLYSTYLPESTVELRPEQPGSEQLGGPAELLVVLGPAGIAAFAACMRTYLQTRKNSLKIETGSGRDHKLIELTCLGDASVEMQKVIETLQAWNDETQDL